MSTEPNATEPAASRVQRIVALARKHWIASLIAASLTLHTLGFSYYRFTRPAPTEPPPAEIGLGTFAYFAARPPLPNIRSARFELHVGLLDPADAQAQARLKARHFKLQQDIETLIRQAHGADFEDPSLAELKRRLQAQINESLGMKVVSDVIITSLTLERAAPGEQPSETAGASPAPPAEPKPAG